MKKSYSITMGSKAEQQTAAGVTGLDFNDNVAQNEPIVKEGEKKSLKNQTRFSVNAHKEEQLVIIQRTNPMRDDYHVGIKKIGIPQVPNASNEAQRTSTSETQLTNMPDDNVAQQGQNVN